MKELGGGVSNLVWLVEDGGQRIVHKQALAKLRVEEDWYSDRERIFRESDALKRLAPLLPPGSVPIVVAEDRENFSYAMTAAPLDAVTWKSQLMDGICEPATAEAVARIQRVILRQMWHDFSDLRVFEQLRLHAYYEVTAGRHPDLVPHFQKALEAARTCKRGLVHGDWSPKNILVAGGAVMAIDFEVVHLGDPSYDSAFLLNHFLLKMFHRPKYARELRRLALRYWECLEGDEPGTLLHIPLLLLARVDGKSPAEYLTDKQPVREFARDLLEQPSRSIAEVFARHPAVRTA